MNKFSVSRDFAIMSTDCQTNMKKLGRVVIHATPPSSNILKIGFPMF